MTKYNTFVHFYWANVSWEKELKHLICSVTLAFSGYSIFSSHQCLKRSWKTILILLYSPEQHIIIIVLLQYYYYYPESGIGRCTARLAVADHRSLGSRAEELQRRRGGHGGTAAEVVLVSLSSQVWTSDHYQGIRGTSLSASCPDRSSARAMLDCGGRSGKKKHLPRRGHEHATTTLRLVQASCRYMIQQFHARNSFQWTTSTQRTRERQRKGRIRGEEMWRGGSREEIKRKRRRRRRRRGGKMMDVGKREGKNANKVFL